MTLCDHVGNVVDVEYDPTLCEPDCKVQAPAEYTAVPDQLQGSCPSGTQMPPFGLNISVIVK